MKNTKRFAKLPSLDGWRAVSIALVLLCHSTYTSGFPKIWNGQLQNYCEQVGTWGVRFFFVISGFLITYLLLQERAGNGFISLKNFYARRAIRILPVCYFYLLVLGVFTEFSQNSVAWLFNVTFTTNFAGPFHPFQTHHLWSLGVEEQFYLLWPCLLVYLLNRPEGIIKLLKILLVPLIVAPVVRMMYYKHWYPDSLQWLFFYYSFFAEFDSLAYGCLAAIWFSNWRNLLEIFFKKFPYLVACGGVALAFAPWLLPLPGRVGAAAFNSLQAMGFSLLLLQSVLEPGRAFYRCLNWKWVSHIGVLSYSIYVWQQMFCATDTAVFGFRNVWWLSFPLWILPALLAAHASYYLLERPLLKLRAKFHTF